MNAELTSITLNSSTAFQIAPAKLGWTAMPLFLATAPEPEMALGWDAMPAFGEAFGSAAKVEVEAEFTRETPPVTRKTGALTSFWSAMGRVVTHA